MVISSWAGRKERQIEAERLSVKLGEAFPSEVSGEGGRKRLVLGRMPNKVVVRRSLFTGRALVEGHVVDAGHLRANTAAALQQAGRLLEAWEALPPDQRPKGR